MISNQFCGQGTLCWGVMFRFKVEVGKVLLQPLYLVRKQQWLDRSNIILTVILLSVKAPGTQNLPVIEFLSFFFFFPKILRVF